MNYVVSSHQNTQPGKKIESYLASSIWKTQSN